MVAALSAASLSIIGKHYHSRGTILDIFLLSQMSLLGNLTSKILLHAHDSTTVSLIASYVFSRWVRFSSPIEYDQNKKGTFMVGGYLFLLALQYLIIGYFPQLDSHMSIGFFGSMVTATFKDNVFLIIILSLFLMAYFYKKNSINRNTIEINILNNPTKSHFELLLFSIPLITSLYGLGFLYTMSFLLLPTLVVGKMFSSEKIATIMIALISLFFSIFGLGLSISFERLSTSSLQISLLFFVLLTTYLWKKSIPSSI